MADKQDPVYAEHATRIDDRIDEFEKRMDLMTDSIDAIRGTLWKIFSAIFLVGGLWATFMYWHVAGIGLSADRAVAGVHELQIIAAETNQKLTYHEHFAVEIQRLEQRIREIENGGNP